MPTDVRPEGPNGGRRVSEETRTKIRDAARARFAALTPEQQEAQRARLRRGGPPPAAPPANGGPASPLDDALGARRAPDPEGPQHVAPGRNGHDRAAGPPIFRVPELPVLEAGEPAIGGPPLEEETAVAAGITVSEAQVSTLLRFPFELVALRRGEHWKLRDDEAAMIAEPLTRKINENALAARAIGAGGDWVVIVGGLAIVVSARVAEDAERERARSAKPGAGRVPEGRGDRDRGAPGRPDARGAVGSLNGVPVAGPGRARDDDGPEALDSEAAGHPLVQAL